MNKVWVLDLDTLECYENVLAEMRKEVGRTLNRFECEQIFEEVMKQRGIKPAGQNELTKAEFIKELVSKGKKILNVDKDGFTFIKKKEK